MENHAITHGIRVKCAKEKAHYIEVFSERKDEEEEEVEAEGGYKTKDEEQLPPASGNIEFMT